MSYVTLIEKLLADQETPEQKEAMQVVCDQVRHYIRLLFSCNFVDLTEVGDGYFTVGKNLCFGHVAIALKVDDVGGRPDILYSVEHWLDPKGPECHLMMDHFFDAVTFAGSLFSLCSTPHPIKTEAERPV